MSRFPLLCRHRKKKTMSESGKMKMMNVADFLKRRPRNYNFTVPEKMHFLDCLQNYIDVTENRSLDNSAIIHKKKTWEMLVVQYNERFPNGPKRDYAQLKDLYRRMKIMARKVQAQRFRDLEPGEQVIVPDQAVERLIQIMFSANNFSPTDYLNVQLWETFLTPQTELKVLGDEDEESQQENESDITGYVTYQSDSNHSFSEKRIVHSFSVKSEKGAKSHKNSDNVVSTSAGKIRLPKDIQVTELPAGLPQDNTISQFADMCDTSESLENNQERYEDAPSEQLSYTNGLSSHQLNHKLLEMAKAEHQMKIRVHEASLEVLELQKQKLLKEIEKL